MACDTQSESLLACYKQLLSERTLQQLKEKLNSSQGMNGLKKGMAEIKRLLGAEQ